MKEDKIKEKLDSNLNRPSTPHEIINAQSDALLLVRILSDLVENLEARVSILEKKKV